MFDTGEGLIIKWTLTACFIGVTAMFVIKLGSLLLTGVPKYLLSGEAVKALGSFLWKVLSGGAS